MGAVFRAWGARKHSPPSERGGARWKDCQWDCAFGVNGKGGGGSTAGGRRCLLLHGPSPKGLIRSLPVRSRACRDGHPQYSPRRGPSRFPSSMHHLPRRCPLCPLWLEAKGTGALGARNFFQSLENGRKIFPIIGKNGRIFPTIGKFFSNHWKTIPPPWATGLCKTRGAQAPLSLPSRWRQTRSARRKETRRVPGGSFAPAAAPFSFLGPC